jgi:hypothetical protein
MEQAQAWPGEFLPGFATKGAATSGRVVNGGRWSIRQTWFRSVVMKLLHGCCVVFHALIAGAHAHESLLAPADWHKLICAGAYLALAVVQGILLYVLIRKGKQHDEGLLL